MSTFKVLSQLISVNDICESFIGEFDNSQSVESVFEEWSIDLCDEKSLDPMEQIALVKHNHKIIGWIGFDMLESSKTLYECMEPISGDILISSDTPLLEAIHTVCSRNDSIYLVLKGNSFIGFLVYSHFHKLHFLLKHPTPLLYRHQPFAQNHHIDQPLIFRYNPPLEPMEYAELPKPDKEKTVFLYWIGN